jgi:16S rRNA (guanine(966)-N(2))-methyltransferase RsmD
LFDTLAAWLEGRSVLDLCAGIGSLGIEALSRGAACAVFVDSAPQAVRIIRENLRRCRFEDRAAVWQADALTALHHLAASSCPVDLILADPPYETPAALHILHTVEARPILSPGGMLVVEHRKTVCLPAPTEPLVLVRRREVGDAALSFYRYDIPHDRPGSAHADVLVGLSPPHPGIRR